MAICVTLELERDDDAVVRFAVSDTGIGISSEDQAQLFSRFTQADSSVARKFGGTGLGLAICCQLCGIMGGGAFGLDSGTGRGSTFKFTVPFRRAVSPHDANGAGQPAVRVDLSSSRARRLRILLAEDNHVNQMVIIAMLKSTGHTIDVAGNGVEAIETIKTNPYDVVLMDIHMPEMDGIMATKRIRETGGDNAQIPIIALTANAMRGDREKYLAAGMNDYVSKPIDPAKLHEALARQCGEFVPEMVKRDAPSRASANPDSRTNEALVDLLVSLDDLTGTGG